MSAPDQTDATQPLSFEEVLDQLAEFKGDFTEDDKIAELVTWLSDAAHISKRLAIELAKAQH